MVKILCGQLDSELAKDSEFRSQYYTEAFIICISFEMRSFKNIFNGCRDYINMVPAKIILATSQC